MTPGTVFQLVGKDFHLRVVLSVPRGGRFLTRNLTDLKNFPEMPCFCTSADHEWVNKESTVPLYYLKTLPAAAFEPARLSGMIRVSSIRFPETKLKLICDYILASTAVSESIKSFLKP